MFFTFNNQQIIYNIKQLIVHFSNNTILFAIIKNSFKKNLTLILNQTANNFKKFNKTFNLK